MRQRSRNNFNIKDTKFKLGDVVRAVLNSKEGDKVNSTIHTCIVTEEDFTGRLTKCVSVCNFTGTDPNYLLVKDEWDVSDVDLPNEWFGERKDNTWLICNPQSCIYSEGQEIKYLGNLKEKFPDIWKILCDKTANFTHLQCNCS